MTPATSLLQFLRGRGRLTHLHRPAPPRHAPPGLLVSRFPHSATRRPQVTSTMRIAPCHLRDRLRLRCLEAEDRMIRGDSPGALHSGRGINFAPSAQRADPGRIFAEPVRRANNRSGSHRNGCVGHAAYGCPPGIVAGFSVRTARSARDGSETLAVVANAGGCANTSSIRAWPVASSFFSVALAVCVGARRGSTCSNRFVSTLTLRGAQTRFGLQIHRFANANRVCAPHRF
jgi:hypothetical protein